MLGAQHLHAVRYEIMTLLFAISLGHFQLENLTSPFRLMAYHSEYAIRYFYPLANEHMELVFTKPISVAGQVADSFGDPVVGADLFLSHSPSYFLTTESNEQGTFRLNDVTQGWCKLSVTAPCLAAHLTELRLDNDGVNDLVVTLAAEASLEGTVTFSSQTTCMVVTVKIMKLDGLDESTYIDADGLGFYRIGGLVPGFYEVFYSDRIEKSGYLRARRVHLREGRNQLDMELLKTFTVGNWLESHIRDFQDWVVDR